MSALSLGGMLFGASQTLMKGVTSSEEEARRVFDRAVEAGINLVDTANVYTEGRSEELATFLSCLLAKLKRLDHHPCGLLK